MHIYHVEPVIARVARTGSTVGSTVLHKFHRLNKLTYRHP